MNKIIAVIAIVFAFTLGTIFSADIATAVKPETSSKQPTGLAIQLLGTSQTITCSGGSPIALKTKTMFYDDGDTARQDVFLEHGSSGADFRTTIIRASISSTEFTLDTLTITDQICGDGVGIGVITGSCGNSQTVTYTDDDGRTLSLLADVACVSP